MSSTTAASLSHQRVSITVVCSLLIAIVLLHAVFIRLPAHHAVRVEGKQQLQNTRLLQILQQAKDKVASSRSSSNNNRHPPQPKQPLKLQPQCQLDDRQLQRLLATLAGFQAAHGFPEAFPTRQDARSAAIQLRHKLQDHWTAALRPFAAQQEATAANSSCKSIGLVSHDGAPGATAGNKQHRKTALLLVMGNWDSLEHLLGLYAINLFTIWSYARLHGYGLELYVHGQPLPHAMPIYFIKVLGVQHLFQQLGYQHVLYLDFDTFTSPHTAPPLSLFYGEFPAASLLMQAEHNVCAAAMLWRNTADADTLLQAWWDVGAAGCCPTFPHDQTALKHVLLVYLANVTGQHWLYGPDMQQRFKLPQHPPPAAAVAPAATATEAAKVLSTDHMPHKVSTWLKLRPVLQERRSAIGWVGLDVHYPRPPGGAYSRVVLHNCLGMWWGCVPFDTPSLLYHTGHWAMEELEDTWLAERLLHSVVDWASTLDLQDSGATADDDDGW